MTTVSRLMSARKRVKFQQPFRFPQLIRVALRSRTASALGPLGTATWRVAAGSDAAEDRPEDSATDLTVPESDAATAVAVPPAKPVAAITASAVVILMLFIDAPTVGCVKDGGLRGLGQRGTASTWRASNPGYRAVDDRCGGPWGAGSSCCGPGP